MTSSNEGDRADDGPAQPERRASERRKQPDRRYNRRPPVSDVPPPYFETFDRMATALEAIERSVARRVIDLDERERRAATEPAPAEKA